MMNKTIFAVMLNAVAITATAATALDLERMTRDTTYSNTIRSLAENDEHFSVISRELSEQVLRAAELGRLPDDQQLRLTTALSLAAQYYNNEYPSFNLDVDRLKGVLLTLVQNSDPKVYFFAATAFADFSVDGDAEMLYEAMFPSASGDDAKHRALVSSFLVMCDPSRSDLLKRIISESESVVTREAAQDVLERIRDTDLIHRCQAKRGGSPR